MTAGDSELFQRIERVYATGEPFRARHMHLTALVDQVPLSAVADISISRHGNSVLLIWRIEDEAARLASLLQHAQRLGRIGGFEENLLTGQISWNSQMFDLYGRSATSPPVPLEDLPAHAHPDDAVTIGRFLRTLLHHRRPASAAFRLQRPRRGQPPPPGGRRAGPRHRRPAVRGPRRLPGHLGPALDGGGAGRHPRPARPHRAAGRRTQPAGAAVAARHHAPGAGAAADARPGGRGTLPAAETEQLVGGDWYDAVVLPSRRVLLCVGDVAGHGIEAATSMVVLRNALRGLAVTGAGPGQLLSWLNIVAHHLTGAVTATAVCGLYDPGRRTLRWARAGHLPPVLVRGPDAAPLPLVKGILLGAVPEAVYEEAEVQLAPDDTLLMYTDGLVERRDRSVEESLTHLLTTARTAPRTLDQQLDRLLTYSRSDTDDDTCLVGVRVD
ncbi:hypothetical protein GCM10020295_13930 [Streptomyces cinereospinus]